LKAAYNAKVDEEQLETRGLKMFAERKFDKLVAKVEKTREKTAELFKEHKEQVETTNELRMTHYVKKLPMMLRQMELLEYERMREMKTCVSTYLDKDKEMHERCARDARLLHEYVSKSAPHADLEGWVRRNMSEHGKPPTLINFRYELPCSADHMDSPDEGWISYINKVFQHDPVKNGYANLTWKSEEEKTETDNSGKKFKDKHVHVIRTTAAFATDDQELLSYDEHQLIRITNKNNKIWWVGKKILPSGILDNFDKRIKVADVVTCPVDAKINLKHLLQLSKGLRIFRDHLSKEYSEENIQFWIKCRNYRLIDELDHMRLADEGTTIVERYVTQNSESQVNLKGHHFKEIMERYEAGMAKLPPVLPTNLFDEAAEEIFNLLERDSYSRFVRSESFIEYIKSQSK
jgi:hypothetical protein